VVGEFDPKGTLDLVQDFLKDWKPGVPYQRIPQPADTHVEAERIKIETPDKANAIYLAGLNLALRDTDPDEAALDIGDFILGGGSLSSRLGDRVRQKDGLSYGVGSSYAASSLDPSAHFMFFAICNPINIDKVDKAIAEEVVRLLKEGVGDKELAEAKDAYLKANKVSRSSDSQLAGLLASALEAGRTLEYDAALEKKIAALTADEVNAALRKHLTPGRLVIVEAGDFKKNSPPK
jgi:zinc protease